MKKSKFILFAFLVFVAWNAPAQNRLRIAILDLNAGVNRTQSQVDGLADMLSVELFNSGCFSIVERTQVDKVIREQHFQMSELSDAQRQKIGGLLKVDAIVTGTINFIPRDTRYGSDYSSKYDVGEYNVDIRLVSVNTGEWLSVAGGEQKGCTERELMRHVAMQRQTIWNFPTRMSQRHPRLIFCMIIYMSIPRIWVFSPLHQHR